jgi:hypothetical protein
VIIKEKDADLRRVSAGLLAHWLVHLAPATPRGTAEATIPGALQVILRFATLKLLYVMTRAGAAVAVAARPALGEIAGGCGPARGSTVVT